MNNEVRGGPEGEEMHQQVRAPTTESSQHRKAHLIRALQPSNTKGFAPLLGGKHESEMMARRHTTVQAHDDPEPPGSIAVVAAISDQYQVYSALSSLKTSNGETSR